MSIGQGRAPFLPMPFGGVAATMRIRGVFVGGGIVVESVIVVTLFWSIVLYRNEVLAFWGETKRVSE